MVCQFPRLQAVPKMLKVCCLFLVTDVKNPHARGAHRLAVDPSTDLGGAAILPSSSLGPNASLLPEQVCPVI